MDKYSSYIPDKNTIKYPFGTDDILRWGIPGQVNNIMNKYSNPIYKDDGQPIVINLKRKKIFKSN